MAIVPLTNDISIRGIRDVINQKAVVLGQMRFRGTTYGFYGANQNTGFIQVILKNTQTTDDITIKVELKKDNTVYSSDTKTLTPGQKGTFTFSGLDGKAGGFSKARATSGRAAGSYGANHDYDLSIAEIGGEERSESFDNINIGSSGAEMRYRVTAMFNQYPLIDIGMVTNTTTVTANYELRDGVQIPGIITTTNSGLSQWRGAQVIHGTALTRSTKRGRYGSDTNTGFIQIALDPRGFSDGPVTITLPNIKSITKNISQAADKSFTFLNLRRGDYNVYIKDELTGIESIMVFPVTDVSYYSGYTHRSYSFNGDKRMLAFKF